jgi:hypothetical protein
MELFIMLLPVGKVCKGVFLVVYSFADTKYNIIQQFVCK